MLNPDVVFFLDPPGGIPFREVLPNRLMIIGNKTLVDGDPQQGRSKAFGHRMDPVKSLPRIAVEVLLQHQLVVFQYQQAMDIGDLAGQDLID